MQNDIMLYVSDVLKNERNFMINVFSGENECHFLIINNGRNTILNLNK